MKKILILALLLMPFLSFATFSKDLYYGLRKDSQVSELQEFLADNGYYSGQVTGNFFSLTLKAVKSFQTANSLPSTGYFGPLSRVKANAILVASGITDTEISDEQGKPIAKPLTSPPKTTNDIIASLTSQIVLLQQQLVEMQNQKQSLGAITQEQKTQTASLIQIASTTQATSTKTNDSIIKTLQEQNTLLQQQNEKLQQIQTNTTPVPPPSPPEPKKELKIITKNCRVNEDTRWCDLDIEYSENNTLKSEVSVTLSSDDINKTISCYAYPCSGGVQTDTQGTREGNPITGTTGLANSGVTNNRIGAYFVLHASTTTLPTLTAIANGISETLQLK